MRNCHAQDSADDFYLLDADGGSRGQHQDTLRQALGNRQPVCNIRHGRGVRLHAVAPGIEVAPREHVLRPQDFLQLVAAQHCPRIVDLQHNVVVVAFFAAVELDHLHARDALQAAAICLIIAKVYVNKLRQAL